MSDIVLSGNTARNDELQRRRYVLELSVGRNVSNADAKAIAAEADAYYNYLFCDIDRTRTEISTPVVVSPPKV